MGFPTTRKNLILKPALARKPVQMNSNQTQQYAIHRQIVLQHHPPTPMMAGGTLGSSDTTFDQCSVFGPEKGRILESLSIVAA